MLLILIIAAIAGYITPMAEPHVTRLINKVTSDGIEFEAGELRAVTFAVLMLAVAVLAVITGTKAAAFPVALGGFLGLAGARIYQLTRAEVDRRKNQGIEED